MKNSIIKYIAVLLLGVAIGVPLAAQNASKTTLVRELSELSRQQKEMGLKLSRMEQQQNFVYEVIKRMGAEGPAAAAKRNMPPEEDYTTVHEIPVDQSVIKGKKDAPVTIVEFTDFQCPFCRRFHPAIEETFAAYPDQVKLVIKNFPLSFHQQARPAAKAALAAGEQGKYWEMAELLLKNETPLSEESYRELAKQLGLDVEQFLNDYKEKDARWEEIIQKDLALGQKVGVRGTPTFFINGRKTRARSLEGFRQEIDAILKKPAEGPNS